MKRPINFKKQLLILIMMIPVAHVLLEWLGISFDTPSKFWFICFISSHLVGDFVNMILEVIEESKE